MASEIVINQDDVLVSDSHVVIADLIVDAKVSEVSPVVQVFNEEYVLSSGGGYANGNGLIGAVPSWILDAIQEQLTTGDGNLTQVLYDLRDLMTSFQIGVNQSIASLNTSTLSQSSIITTLASQVDNNRAEAINLVATKVTATEAQAVSVAAIRSAFNGGTAEAFVGNIASTYVDKDSAIAQDVKLVTAELNGLSANITSVESVVLQEIAVSQLTQAAIRDLQGQIDGVIDSWYYSYVPIVTNLPWSTWNAVDVAAGNTLEQDQHTGDLFYNLLDGTAYRFVKSNGVFGWAIVTDTAVTLALSKAAAAQSTADGKASSYYKTQAEINAITATWTAQNKIDNVGDTWVNSATSITSTWNGSAWINTQTTWAATASKLITSPTGAVTGWSFGDGTGINSYFDIRATNFKISDSVTAYTPFSIKGGNIELNGTVNINKLSSSIFIGTYSSAPSTVSVTIGTVTYSLKDGDTYKNSTNNTVYYRSGTSWLSTQGVTGASTFTATVYKQTSSTPISPSGGNYNFSTNTITAPSEWVVMQPATTTVPTYACEYTFTTNIVGATVAAGVWGAVRIDAVKGTDGTSGTSVNMVEIYSTSSTKPTSGAYNFATNTISSLTAGWSMTQPASSTTPTYMSRRRFSVVAPATSATDGTWSTPVVVAQNGAVGNRGAMSVFATGLSTPPTDAQLRNAIAQAVNGTSTVTLIRGDNVTYTHGTTGTKQAYYTGTVWVKDVALYINGDAVIDGTITAKQIAADAINGKQIIGGYIKGSWFDPENSFILSSYKTATTPTTYAANFAHDEQNNLLTINTYYRLPASDVCLSNAESYALLNTNGQSFSISTGVYMYDYEAINTKNRIKHSIFQFNTIGKSDFLGFSSSETSGVSFSATCVIAGVSYSITVSGSYSQVLDFSITDGTTTVTRGTSEYFVTNNGIYPFTGSYAYISPYSKTSVFSNGVAFYVAMEIGATTHAVMIKIGLVRTLTISVPRGAVSVFGAVTLNSHSTLSQLSVVSPVFMCR